MEASPLVLYRPAMSPELSDELVRRLDQEHASAVFIVSDTGTLRWCNAAGERVLGCVRQDAIGQPINDLLSRRAENNHRRSSMAALTARQTEILNLIADGMSSPEIARRLGRSVKTIEAHRSHIMKRLGIHNLAGLIRYAMMNNNHPR